VEQQRLLLRCRLDAGEDVEPFVEAVESRGLDRTAQGGDVGAHMVPESLGVAADDAVGMVHLGMECGRAPLARRGDLEGVAIDVGGGPGLADLFQHRRLAEQGGEIIGLHRQGVVQRRQGTVEIAHHPQGQGAVQRAAVGRAQGVGLIDQPDGGLRITLRQSLAGAVQQVVLWSVLVHVGSPELILLHDGDERQRSAVKSVWPGQGFSFPCGPRSSANA